MSGLPLWCTDLRFGLPRASPPLQGPILRYFSPLLDFLLPPLCLKVQSSAISRSFWTSSCLSSASRSNPPIFLAPFGLSRISPPLQSPIRSSSSLPTTQKRRIAKQSASLNPPILINQSNPPSANSTK